MGKAKLFGTIGKMALGAVAPDVLEQGTKIVNDQLEKRKDYLKIPDVKLLDVEKATAVIDKYNFNHSEVPVKADLQYADALPNTIVKMEPKGNTTVAPNTFVKLHYIDEQTVIDSQLLAQEAESKKALKKQKTQDQIHNVLETTSNVSANIGKKLHFKKEKKDND
ncbi:PASTA domain-containing protein [Leuconostoc pseudomesenteroides]|uniref:PASTA domain-containing protein n=1 Tax=Leuconostoc pseudomesenteroides TaxID=33968 RepID=UPI0039ECF296